MGKLAHSAGAKCRRRSLGASTTVGHLLGLPLSGLHTPALGDLLAQVLVASRTNNLKDLSGSDRAGGADSNGTSEGRGCHAFQTN